MQIAHLIPLRFAQSSAPEVAQLFYDNLVRYHGLPTTIVGDRDPRWLSTFFRAVLTLSGIKASHTSKFRPSSNGVNERSHAVLYESLRFLCDSNPDL